LRGSAPSLCSWKDDTSSPAVVQPLSRHDPFAGNEGAAGPTGQLTAVPPYTRLADETPDLTGRQEHLLTRLCNGAPEGCASGLISVDAGSRKVVTE